jgi:hypothetical protein
MTTRITATDPSPLRAVLDVLVPYWAAEEEICRTHLSRTGRPADVEVEWLARQAAKELHDGVEPRLDRVRAAVRSQASAAAIARETEELHEEAAHFVAFADAHDAVAGPAGLPLLDERDLLVLASWPENDELRRLRARHHDAHGAVGDLATTFTEGGCAALFAAGAAVAGGTAADRAIASACAAVLDDELEHLGAGFRDLADRADDVDPLVLERLVVEQSIARLRMRQSQFAHPVPAGRMVELERGVASPADVRSVERRLDRAGPA